MLPPRYLSVFLLAILLLALGGSVVVDAPRATEDWAGLLGYWQLTAEDRALVNKVHAAASRGLSPEKAEPFVGQPPRWSMRRGEVVVDAPLVPAEQPNFHEARNVKFWVRPTSSEETRIIGIIWDQEGEPKVFYGRIVARD